MPISSPAHLKAPAKRSLSRKRSRTYNGLLLDSTFCNEPHPTSRTFIKSKDDKFVSIDREDRRSSMVRLSLGETKTARPIVPKSASGLPRRKAPRSSSASLLAPVTNKSCTQAALVPRSSTVMHTHNLQIPSERCLSSYSSNNAPHRSRQAKGHEEENKENDAMQVTAARRQIRSRRSFTRRHSPLVPRERRSTQCLPRAFLIPKVEESICTPDIKAPPLASTFPQPVAPPQSGKHESQFRVASKDPALALASLPTQILSRTPKVTTGRRNPSATFTAAKRLMPTVVAGSSEADVGDYRARAAAPQVSATTATPPCRATPSLAAQMLKYALQASSVATASGLSPSPSLCTLPTQILRHSPVPDASAVPAPFAGLRALQEWKSDPTSSPASNPTTTASESPCLSRARTKSIWTMADEITLVRTGGMIPDMRTLEPGADVRVVPLCRRLRNGFSFGAAVLVASSSAEALASPRTPQARMSTPIRSASTPYHLLAASARHTPDARASLLSPDLSISRVLAHVEEVPTDDDNNDTNGGARSSPSIFHDDPHRDSTVHARAPDRLSWTVVNIKRLARGSVGKSGGRSLAHPNRPSPGGCGVSIARGSGSGSGGRPSLLTRAQTFLKFKFTGPRLLASRKLVGRGDSRF